MDQNLPHLSANYPWLLAHNLDGTGDDDAFYTIHDQICRYKCRIPKLLGTRIRGYFHGWVILSNDKNIMWSLWNPTISEIIYLPPLKLSRFESVGQCCLSSPPDDPTSVLLLTINEKQTLVLCQLGMKNSNIRNKLVISWRRLAYTRQLKEITGHYGGFLKCLTSYNGKVFALTCNPADFVVEVDVIVKNGRKVPIKLVLLGRRPYINPPDTRFPKSTGLLKGTCTELFYIMVAFNEVTKKTVGNVYLFKWVMTSMMWEEMATIGDDVVFFVDLAHDNHFVYHNHAITSELGGYVHIRDPTGKMMYSYHAEDKTISLSTSSQLTTIDYENERSDKGNEEDGLNDESNQLSSRYLPFHLLEIIMDHCVGVEYMRFRATCKSCHLAAPVIQWSNKTTSLRRLHDYSLVSPWLMVADKTRGVISFTDPVSGEKYHMKRSQVSSINRVFCSRFGWLLFSSDSDDDTPKLLFFNPFTSESHVLPRMESSSRLDSVCFSAPPTSPNCMVVGFITSSKETDVLIHFVSCRQQGTWSKIHLDFGGAAPRHFCFPTFCGWYLYAVCDKGGVYVIKSLSKSVNKVAVARRSCRGEYFLVKRDHQLLLVTVSGEFSECVEVFKWDDYSEEWEKIECLGRYMIYIDRVTCLCIEAQLPEMRNKIFFPRLHAKNGNVVFYSLETQRYHIFNNDKKVKEVVGFGRKHVSPHAWIEPTWSYLAN